MTKAIPDTWESAWHSVLNIVFSHGTLTISQISRIGQSHSESLMDQDKNKRTL